MTAALLRADLDSVQNIFQLFRWTLTAVGIGVVFVGLALFFYRGNQDTSSSNSDPNHSGEEDIGPPETGADETEKKAASKPTPYSARLTALICFTAIGTGTIAYAWIWFGR